MNELIDFLVGSSEFVDVPFIARCIVLSVAFDFISIIFSSIGKLR